MHFVCTNLQRFELKILGFPRVVPPRPADQNDFNAISGAGDFRPAGSIASSSQGSLLGRRFIDDMRI
jgi:hypothetical protein